MLDMSTSNFEIILWETTPNFTQYLKVGTQLIHLAFTLNLYWILIIVLVKWTCGHQYLSPWHLPSKTVFFRPHPTVIIIIRSLYLNLTHKCYFMINIHNIKEDVCKKRYPKILKIGQVMRNLDIDQFPAEISNSSNICQFLRSGSNCCPALYEI